MPRGSECGVTAPSTMESGLKSEANGVDGRNGRAAKVDEPAGASLCAGLGLRLLAVSTTLIAAVVMGTARQAKTLRIEVAPTLPLPPVTATAKFSHSSAFIYFIVANAIVSVYGACSLAAQIALGRRAGAEGSLLLPGMAILDAVAVALLFSGNGAAAAFGVIGEYGNSHVGWKKVCGVYGGFCRQVSAAIIVSLVAAVAFLLLVSFSVLRLHRKSSYVDN